MKQHYHYVLRESPAPNGSKYDQIPVGLDVVMGEAVMELVESGIDEDAHFWGSDWRDIDDDEIELVINDPLTSFKMVEYIRPLLIDKLKKILESRRAENARHSTG